MDSDSLMPVLAGVLRHVLTTFGGVLITGGYMQSADLPAFIGGGMVLAGIGWSWWQKVGQKRAMELLAKAKAPAAKAAVIVVVIGFAFAPAPRARAQTAASNPIQTVVTQVQTVLNSLITAASNITAADLNLALADAKAQGNTGAAACWTSLLALNLQPVPTGAGLAYLKQRLLDAEAQYVSVNQNCNGPAPLIVKAYDAFVAEAQNLQI